MKKRYPDAANQKKLCRGTIVSFCKWRAILLPFISLTLLSFILSFPFSSEASDVTIEKDLQRSLEESRSIIKAARQKLEEGDSINTEIINLKEIAEHVRASHLLLMERFRLREEGIKELGLTARERHGTMIEEYRKAVEEYLKLIDSLPSEGTIPQSAIDSLQSLLDKILRRRGSRSLEACLTEISIIHQDNLREILL